MFIERHRFQSGRSSRGVHEKKSQTHRTACMWPTLPPSTPQKKQNARTCSYRVRLSSTPKHPENWKMQAFPQTGETHAWGLDSISPRAPARIKTPFSPAVETRRRSGRRRQQPCASGLPRNRNLWQVLSERRRVTVAPVHICISYREFWKHVPDARKDECFRHVN